MVSLWEAGGCVANASATCLAIVQHVGGRKLTPTYASTQAVEGTDIGDNSSHERLALFPIDAQQLVKSAKTRAAQDLPHTMLPRACHSPASRSPPAARMRPGKSGLGTMGKLVTHYDNLKVDRTAPPAVIKAAYRALAQQYHPDVNKDPDASRIMRLINRAYGVLSNAELRAEHDAWIRDQERSYPSGHAIGTEWAYTPRRPTSPASAPGMWEKLGQGLIFVILFLMAWSAVVIAARLVSVGIYTFASIYPAPEMLGIYRFILRLLDWIPMLIWSPFVAWGLAKRWSKRLLQGKGCVGSPAAKKDFEPDADEEFERFLQELDKK